MFALLRRLLGRTFSSMFALLRRLLGRTFIRKPGHHDRSAQWSSVRRKYLSKHAVCAACGSDKYLEVHHKKPFHLHPDLELREDNLITLCEDGRRGARNCHFVFGHAYHWKGYNPDVAEDSAAFLRKVKASEKLGKS